jgi:hypothetical protein
MTKRIAVLVTNRRGEALRMALGLTLMDDVVDVYFLDGRLEAAEPEALDLDLLKEMGLKVYSNRRDEAEMEFASIAEIAETLPGYDHVIPY